MIGNRFGSLEVLTRSPEGRPPHPIPLLFVHGAYTAAWCWEAHFLPWFAERGFSVYAVSLSGHGGSHGKAILDGLSISDYVSDVEKVVAAMPAPPVLIGHSMGGMVVQKFLERHTVPAAVLMASVPPQGLWSSAVGLVFKNPGMLQDLNALMGGGHPRVESLRDALFHQPIDEATLMDYYRRCQPESHRAVWDMTLFNLPHTHLMNKVPMLILGAEHDQLIPASLVTMTAHTYGQQAEIFPDMGHGMMLERDWEKVAQRLAEWLEQTLGAPPDIPSSS
ncbi:MAG: alpha/beta hydrolase [Zoogloeaceae bacterium]|nr:alpha/beta hydrolase [Zoogloeaceae bacterium]